MNLNFLGYKSKKLILLMTIVTAVFGFSAVFPNQQSLANEVDVRLPYTYIVKLNYNNPEVLKNSLGVIKNIQPVYAKSDQSELNKIYSFESTQSLQNLQSLLFGQYEYLELSQTYSLELQVDDPGFTNNALNIDKQWGLAKAKFINAWDLTTGSRDVVVAVIDTGIDTTHEDFNGAKFATGYDFVNDNFISRRGNYDDNGHGTLVAGVIAATANNSIGVAGAASGVTIMPIKALSSRGSGSSKQISNAIIWATDNGANVINMSLGGIGFSHDSTLAGAVSYAFNKGVVIVAAAGNDVAITGGNLDKDPVFPICHDNDRNMIIGVTATDQNDLKPSFANYGKACVDVSAPGKRILSAINHDPASGSFSPDSYAYASGTSLATPFVSAQAALIKSLFPEATNSQIRDRIISSSDPIDTSNLSQCGGGSCAGFLGGGRINVLKSLSEKFITIADGDIVTTVGSDNWYLINGSKRQLISSFVRTQRFNNVTPTVVSVQELNNFPEGSFAPPLDGTLVKVPNNPTVFYLNKGVRQPISYQVFLLYKFNLEDVKVLPDTEVNSWIEGSFLTPPDGTLIRSISNQTVYWVVNKTLHPINAGFFQARGLNIFPIIFVSDQDLNGLPTGESYIL